MATMVRMFRPLRLILTWLLLAALPLQGVAAAAMVLCQQGVHAAHAVHTPEALPGHAMHAGHHAGRESADPAGLHLATHAGDHVHAPLAAGLDLDATPAGHGLQADASHHCMACSLCSHALGLASDMAVMATAPAPQGPVACAPPRVASRVAPIPDKPPRA